MEKYSKKTLVCPQNDVITYYDNIGKNIKKQYKISSQKLSSPNIIIAMDSALQQIEDLKKQ